MSLNKVFLLGRLTHEPEVKNSGDSAYCSFQIAVEKNFVDKATGKREADFLRCTAFGKNAENICSFFGKGRMICIEGHLGSNSYTRKDGTEVKNEIQIMVDSFYFCDSKKDASPAGSSSYTGSYNRPAQQPYGQYQQPSYGQLPYQMPPVPTPPAPQYQSGTPDDFQPNTSLFPTGGDKSLPF